jgi:hypothetical protein
MGAHGSYARVTAASSLFSGLHRPGIFITRFFELIALQRYAVVFITGRKAFTPTMWIIHPELFWFPGLKV